MHIDQQKRIDVLKMMMIGEDIHNEPISVIADDTISDLCSPLESGGVPWSLGVPESAVSPLEINNRLMFHLIASRSFLPSS